MTTHNAKDAHQPAVVHVITVSDTRTAADDKSGALLKERLAQAGHTVVGPVIVKDERALIHAAILQAVAEGAQAVVLNGGTGIAPRDVTPEVVTPLLDKVLEGFGEMFRNLSVAEIGPAAMLSRAVAGTRGAVFIAALPGSTAACRLGVEKLIIPVLPHVLGLLRG